MHLLESLQHFPHPALIVTSDSVQANFFLVGGDSLEALDGISVPREMRQDSEGSFTSSDGSRVAGPDADIDDGPRLHEFVHQVIGRIDGLVTKHGIAHVHLVMPAAVEHQTYDHLEQHLKEKIVKRLHLDLMKSAPLEIVERILHG